MCSSDLDAASCAVKWRTTETYKAAGPLTVNRGAAVLKVRYSNDLGQADPWTSHEAVVPDVDSTVGGVFFDTTPDADPAFINVRAEIPASAASPAGRLFGRLYSSDN